MSYSHLLILLVILALSLIKNVSFAQRISSISKSCFLIIRDLRQFVILLIKILPTPLLLLSFIPKIDYCNFLLLNLPATQTNRLQLVLNSAARFVTQTPNFHHITPSLKSLHWLKINERITYKVLSLSHI